MEKKNELVELRKYREFMDKYVNSLLEDNGKWLHKLILVEDTFYNYLKICPTSSDTLIKYQEEIDKLKRELEELREKQKVTDGGKE